MEELKHLLPLLEQYIFELKKHRDKAEEIIAKYFNVLPPELLGSRFVDIFLEEQNDAAYNLLLNALEYRYNVIKSLSDENKMELLSKNEFLLNFLV